MQLSVILVFISVATLVGDSNDWHMCSDQIFDKQDIFPGNKLSHREQVFDINNSIFEFSKQDIYQKKYSRTSNNIIKNQYLTRDFIWINQYKILYTYDGFNNLLSTLRQIWSDGVWINNYQYTDTYDANNNRISSLHQTWDDSEWVNSYFYDYTYDGNNNQISALTQIWSGVSWENQRQDYYSYDSTNNRIGYLAMNWDGVDWVNWFQIIFTYDNNNNMTLFRWRDWDGVDWVNNTQTISTFDANNNWIASLRQDWNGTNWINFEQSTATYDANNNPVENLTQRWNGNTWVNFSLRQTTFDINNNPTLYLEQHWDGANWENIQVGSIVYDANNNQIEYLHQTWDGNSWVNDWQAFKNYDNNNNLLDRVNQNWDGNNWVNNSQWLFTYDAYNNRTSLITQTWHNTTPIIIPIADQEINEDQILILQLSTESDVSNESLSFSAYSDTSSIVLVVDTTSLTITPQTNWNGISQIVIIVFDEVYIESDTTSFNLLVNPVNDPPNPIDLIYPTNQDTFSTHIDSDTIITFNWSGGDIESDIDYDLTISLEFFGNVYVAEYTDIPDTSFELHSNELDALLAGLGYDETELMWYLETTDGEFTVNSDTGSFYLIRGFLEILNEFVVLKNFMLYQNYPNPFNPTTTLRYNLHEQANVNIIIYDMLGRQIETLINQTQDAGYKSVIWDGKDDNGKQVSAGVYLYQLQAGEFVQTKKMVLLK